jgi:hypothetical protein
MSRLSDNRDPLGRATAIMKQLASAPSKWRDQIDPKRNGPPKLEKRTLGKGRLRTVKERSA